MNTHSADHSPASQAKTGDLPGLIMRIVIPCCLLVLGVFAFWWLSQAQEKPQTPPADSKLIRTRVAALVRGDYTVVVKANGMVQAHNEVALSAQVSGQVEKVSPAFEVGSYFSRGDVLVELDDRDYQTAIAVAEATKLGAEAALQLATETYDRNFNLHAKKGVSEAILKQSFAARAQAAAQLDTVTAHLEQARRDLDRTRIRAPFDGRVRQKSVGVGQSVGLGAPLGHVFAIDYAEVRLPISSREQAFLDLPERQSDIPVDVELRDGINATSETVWHAKIVRTEGTLNADTLELFAIARIDDPFGLVSADPPLRIGQPIIASISGKTLDNVVSVPRTAVRQLDQVFFINDGELTNKTLDPIWTDADYLIVADPTIADGQLVAMTRIVYAPDGAKVEIIPDAEIELTTTSTDNKANTLTKPVAK